MNAAHNEGLAVYLDVVYNHLGPEGNYLGDFGPYFTDKYKTPWGPAPNLDGPEADEARAFFVGNALHWMREHRIDGLRLDAVHAIVDNSPLHLVEEIAAAVHEEAERTGRRIHVIAEDARNDPRVIRPADRAGLGCDAVWNDDFHHALRTVLTGERAGYYADYGELRQIADALRDGFAYTGQRSRYRRRRHGRPAPEAEGWRFVVFSQNHDQIGNRAQGDRLERAVGFEAAKLAAAATLLSPCVPLLFMGEEHADPAPFLYFVSHGDADLIEAVRRGRREEFASFGWADDVPDPQDEQTFMRSKINWRLRAEGRHGAMLAYYRALLALRASDPALGAPDRLRTRVELSDAARAIVMHRWSENGEALVLLRFQDGEGEVEFEAPPGTPGTPGTWVRALDSTEARFGGPGAASAERLSGGARVRIRLGPWAAAVYQSTRDPLGASAQGDR